MDKMTFLLISFIGIAILGYLYVSVGKISKRMEQGTEDITGVFNDQNRDSKKIMQTWLIIIGITMAIGGGVIFWTSCLGNEFEKSVDTEELDSLLQEIRDERGIVTFKVTPYWILELYVSRGCIKMSIKTLLNSIAN